MVEGRAHLQASLGVAARPGEAGAGPTCLTPGQFARPHEGAARSTDEVERRGVAHDLRCPLTGILLASQVLLLEVGAGDPHRRRRLEMIVRSARRALALTDELARGGDRPLRLAEHDLADVVRDVVELHGPHADASRVTVRADLPGPPTPARVDRPQLGRALANLVGNAIKFSSPGGLVLVTVETPSPGAARLVVTDQGPGLSPDALARLFADDPPPRDADRGGLGLGLGIARAIAQAHGGEVGARSRPGQGCAFWLELPAAGQVG